MNTAEGQVHRGFLRAFQSVVANKLPGYTLDAVAANLTGVQPADITMCGTQFNNRLGWDTYIRARLGLHKHALEFS